MSKLCSKNELCHKYLLFRLMPRLTIYKLKYIWLQAQCIWTLDSGQVQTCLNGISRGVFKSQSYKVGKTIIWEIFKSYAVQILKMLTFQASLILSKLRNPLKALYITQNDKASILVTCVTCFMGFILRDFRDRSFELERIVLYQVCLISIAWCLILVQVNNSQLVRTDWNSQIFRQSNTPEIVIYFPLL